MEDKSAFDRHPTEEMLEEYVFNRLPETAAGALEEHVLICTLCQQNLEEVDDYIRLMKAATADDRRGHLWPHIRAVLARPGLISTGIAALAGIVFFTTITLRPPPVPGSASVSLAAFRGSDGVTVAKAPKGRDLDLEIDVPDAPPAASYGLEVVNGIGRRAWKGKGVASNGKLLARVPAGLTTGVHWVRMYSAGGELLREFGFRIE